VEPIAAGFLLAAACGGGYSDNPSCPAAICICAIMRLLARSVAYESSNPQAGRAELWLSLANNTNGGAQERHGDHEPDNDIGPAEASHRTAAAAMSIARLSCLFPRLEGNSPRMEEPERRVTGASPAYAARWPAEAKARLTTSIRSLAAVLTPTPGMLVRTG